MANYFTAQAPALPPAPAPASGNPVLSGVAGAVKGLTNTIVPMLNESRKARADMARRRQERDWRLADMMTEHGYRQDQMREEHGFRSGESRLGRQHDADQMASQQAFQGEQRDLDRQSAERIAKQGQKLGAIRRGRVLGQAAEDRGSAGY